MTKYISYDYEKHEYFADTNARHDHYQYISDKDIFVEMIPPELEKEIHFLSFYPYNLRADNLQVGYEETISAIERGDYLIYTTQIALLDFDLQSLYGYDIYMHDNPDDINDRYLISYDIRQCERTNRQLRRAHNIEKMWKAGEFTK